MDELSPGINLSHYRIISKIGAGGMGEVYLAQDRKLDRKAALKILPAQLAADADRMRRFVQEQRPPRRSIIPTLPTSTKSVKTTAQTSLGWNSSTVRHFAPSCP